MTLLRTTALAAKVIGPSFVSLQVRNLEASKRFYVDLLGLKPTRHSPPEAIVFETAPVPFAIRQPLVDLDATHRLGWGISLWIACSNADALHASLAAAGVSMVTPLGDGPFGRFFVFRDPDGYAVTVHSASSPKSKTVLDADAGSMVFINTFTVEPERSEELLAGLRKATEELIQHQPGFISANLHLSRDKKRIVNYAQWRTQGDYEAMAKNPDVQAHMRELAGLAQSFEPVFYDLREVLTREEGA